ncbi:ethanolamine utilization protein EutH [Bacillus sp. H-16]|uniref:ethanolamine utilization protein EutH n=1 Tax=Alteribacter salitolerans TaxID=2912333 RepID=UPI001966A315|nr:ethanolamine utilization protein EutH [Alteribacter salitolerans]MBM7097537.1 ethanolamine utilization protein EutH [Alteribacter salitolerans]
MWLNDAVIWTIAVFAVVGAADRIFGNRFGYGEQFEKGFLAMGPLALAMVGIICFSPVVAEWLRPVFIPAANLMGADPSVFAGILFAIDMGGYPLSVELSETDQAGLFSGIILATMIGPTFVFTIPVALGLIKKEDHRFFARGILIGLVPVPAGAWLAGVVAGFPAGMVLVNLVPVLVVSVFVMAGLVLFPNGMIRGFIWLGKGIVALFTLMAGVIGFEVLTGVTVVAGTSPAGEAFMIVGMIAITLSGAFPFVHFLKGILGGVMAPVAAKLNVKRVSLVGLVSSLAHSIPVFQVLHEMDSRGKVMNVAFAVSGAFVLGGHLGFVSSVEPQMIVPMIAGKLSAGCLAVGLALITVKGIEES